MSQTPLSPSIATINGKDYHLSKFPATVGREILLQYPTSALPKLGEYKTNHLLMLRIMSYVGVQIEGREGLLMLTTSELVDNHVPDGEALIKLEWAMIQHNYSFFTDGRASDFLGMLVERVGESTSKTLTNFLRQSSAKN